jgi:hypothetical protein
VEYIADNYGISILLTGISSFGKEQETIEKLTGKSLEMLREMWLDNLNEELKASLSN